MLEANRQFRLFVIQSEAEGSGSFRESVTLFKNYEIIKQYNPLTVSEILEKPQTSIREGIAKLTESSTTGTTSPF